MVDRSFLDHDNVLRSSCYAVPPQRWRSHFGAPARIPIFVYWRAILRPHRHQPRLHRREGTPYLSPLTLPTTLCAMQASQLIFGGIGKESHLATNNAQSLNLVGGVVAAGAAAQSSDMTGDLKTGYLLGAKPRNQFIAQLVGSIVAVFLTTGLFILFTKASPCILYPPASGSSLLRLASFKLKEPYSMMLFR